MVNFLDNMFQSLFYWMLYFNKRPIKYYWSFNKVSILVLLDVVLQFVIVCGCASFFLSFNPCFIGCCTSIGRIKMLEISSKGFNPCFIGCCTSIAKMTAALGIPAFLQKSQGIIFDLFFSKIVKIHLISPHFQSRTQPSSSLIPTSLGLDSLKPQ